MTTKIPESYEPLLAAVQKFIVAGESCEAADALVDHLDAFVLARSSELALHPIAGYARIKPGDYWSYHATVADALADARAPVRDMHGPIDTVWIQPYTISLPQSLSHVAEWFIDTINEDISETDHWIPRPTGTMNNTESLAIDASQDAIEDLGMRFARAVREWTYDRTDNGAKFSHIALIGTRIQYDWNPITGRWDHADSAVHARRMHDRVAALTEQLQQSRDMHDVLKGALEHAQKIKRDAETTCERRTIERQEALAQAMNAELALLQQIATLLNYPIDHVPLHQRKAVILSRLESNAKPSTDAPASVPTSLFERANDEHSIKP